MLWQDKGLAKLHRSERQEAAKGGIPCWAGSTRAHPQGLVASFLATWYAAKKQAAGSCNFVLGTHWGKVALTIPAKAFAFAGHRFWFPAWPTLDHTFLVRVRGLAGRELQEAQWASPLHLAKAWGDGAPRGLVALPKGDPRPALHMACRKAFGKLPEVWVDDLARAIKVKAQGTLPEKIGTIIEETLGKMDPQELVEILAQRCFDDANSWDMKWMEDSSLMEEAAFEDFKAVEDPPHNGSRASDFELYPQYKVRCMWVVRCLVRRT